MSPTDPSGRKQPVSSAATGLDDDVVTYAAQTPPLTENAAWEKHNQVLHALVAIISVGGLAAPMLFRPIADPGLYLLAVAAPFLLALLLAGRRMAGAEGGAPQSCALRGVVIAIAFIAVTGGLSGAIQADTWVRGVVIAACMVGTAALFARGLKSGRLAFFVLGLALFTLTFPLLRFVPAASG